MTLDPRSVRRSVGLFVFLLPIVAAPVVIFVALQQHARAVAAEETVENERLKLEVIMDASPIGHVMCDEDGRIEFVNYESIRLLGWSKRELLGRKLASILPADMAKDHTEGQKAFIRNMKANPGEYQVTRIIQHGKALTRSGDTVNVIVRMRAYILNGKVHQLAAIGTDPDFEPKTIIEPLTPPIQHFQQSMKDQTTWQKND